MSLVLELFEEHRDQFDEYSRLLLKWNRKINLTSITDTEKIRTLHFIDSLSLVPEIVSRETIFRSSHVQTQIRLMDIGSGAGFPGIPVKIVRPDLQVTLVESVKKKCDFMKEVARQLKLDHIDVIQRTLRYGETIGKFDVIVTRATFRMEKLIRLAVPNLQPNGIVIGMKGMKGMNGDSVGDEIRESEQILKDYKLRPISMVIYQPPNLKHPRCLLITGNCFT